MRMRPGRAVVIALIALIVGSLSQTVLAASPLNAIAVAVLPNGGARVTVQFSGPPPHYTLTGVGSSEASVIFQGTSMSAAVPPTLAGAGAIKSLSVAQVGPNVAVSLHLSSAVPVRVVPGGNFVIIDVPNAGGDKAANPGFGAQPAAAPPQGTVGQITEIIPLKYADVSEVAGVLIQGANVASNDNFNPQTSNFGTQSIRRCVQRRDRSLFSSRSSQAERRSGATSAVRAKG